MDTLKDKVYKNYPYICRYSGIPEYFDTLSKNKNHLCGIGSNMILNSTFVTHKLKATDTLDSLALDYYGNPSFWWVIAYFNDIQDAFKPLLDNFIILKIPNISSIKFGREN